MNYAQLRKYDIANGSGIHTTLFITGCTFYCKGCFNKEYQNFEFGELFTPQTKHKILNYLNDDKICGFSLLGGEPLIQDIDIVKDLLKSIKFKYPNKSIWVWTGFKIEDLNSKQLELLNYIDILVDGQFIEAEKDLRLKWRGSKNQRVIDVQKSLNQKEIILYEN